MDTFKLISAAEASHALNNYKMVIDRMTTTISLLRDALVTFTDTAEKLRLMQLEKPIPSYTTDQLRQVEEQYHKTLNVAKNHIIATSDYSK
jgi:hypothetical protein